MAANPNLLPWFETARCARLLTMRPSVLERDTYPECPAKPGLEGGGLGRTYRSRVCTSAKADVQWLAPQLDFGQF